MNNPLPALHELQRYCKDSQGLITPRVLQKIIELRRMGDNWSTICVGGLCIPIDVAKQAYGRVPAHMR